MSQPQFSRASALENPCGRASALVQPILIFTRVGTPTLDISKYVEQKISEFNTQACTYQINFIFLVHRKNCFEKISSEFTFCALCIDNIWPLSFCEFRQWHAYRTSGFLGIQFEVRWNSRALLLDLFLIVWENFW